MRHLVALSLIAAAFATYAFSVGPLFFGAPLLGLVLAGLGIALEVAGWWHIFGRRKAESAGPGVGGAAVPYAKSDDGGDGANGGGGGD